MNFLEEPERPLLAGDWHGNAGYATRVIRHAAEEGCDTIVQLGDFGVWPGGGAYLRDIDRTLSECGVSLAFVPGNHEWWPELPLKGRGYHPATIGDTNIVMLPIGYRWEWWGQTWMALGGAASVDRLRRTPGESWWPEELLTDEDVEYASRPGDVDVIVSHDCPYGVDIPKIGIGEPSGNEWPIATLLESRDHRKKVRRAVDAVKPSMLIHGHFHLSYWSGLDLTDGSRVTVRGLDCDGSPLRSHTMMIDAPKLE